MDDFNAMDVDEDFTPPNGPVPESRQATAPTPEMAVERSTYWVPPPMTSDNYYINTEGDAWIHTCWDNTTTPERLIHFLTRWPPSRTPISYCAWISVDRGGHKELQPNVQGLKQSFQDLVAAGNVNVASLDTIAVSHQVLVGKWLIFSDSRRIDELWGKVVQLVCMFRNRGSAKVSTRKEQMKKITKPDGVEVEEEEGHVICVYVDDYTDFEEVKALREGLRGIGVKWKIGFKPDAYTYLGIYSRNNWNLRPTRYYL